MIDIDPDIFCIDVDLIESRISRQTKAIVPMYLFGQCANMDKILRIAEEHKLYVIEDTTQSIGVKYTFIDGTMIVAG